MKLAFIFVALLAAGAGGLVVWLVLRQDSGSGPTAAPTPAPTAPPTPMPTYGKFLVKHRKIATVTDGRFAESSQSFYFFCVFAFRPMGRVRPGTHGFEGSLGIQR